MERSTQYLHPIIRSRAEALIGDMHQAHRNGQIKTWFQPFETFRSPMRQHRLYQQGRQLPGAVVTNAKPFASAHQLGLAMDLVPYMAINPGLASSKYRFVWDAPDSDWEFLSQAAMNRGFKEPPEWDRCHIEDPLFDDFQMIAEARYKE